MLSLSYAPYLLVAFATFFGFPTHETDFAKKLPVTADLVRKCGISPRAPEPRERTLFPALTLTQECSTHLESMDKRLAEQSKIILAQMSIATLCSFYFFISAVAGSSVGRPAPYYTIHALLAFFLIIKPYQSWSQLVRQRKNKIIDAFIASYNWAPLDEPIIKGFRRKHPYRPEAALQEINEYLTHKAMQIRNELDNPVIH